MRVAALAEDGKTLELNPIEVQAGRRSKTDKDHAASGRLLEKGVLVDTGAGASVANGEEQFPITGKGLTFQWNIKPNSE